MPSSKDVAIDFGVLMKQFNEAFMVAGQDLLSTGQAFLELDRTLNRTLGGFPVVENPHVPRGTAYLVQQGGDDEKTILVPIGTVEGPIRYEAVVECIPPVPTRGIRIREEE